MTTTSILSGIRKCIGEHYQGRIAAGQKATILELTEIVGALAICMLEIVDSSGMPDKFLCEILGAAKSVVKKMHSKKSSAKKSDQTVN
jgi:hypothetical protein